MARTCWYSGDDPWRARACHGSSPLYQHVLAMGHHRCTSTSLPWVITAVPARPCHGSSPVYQHVLAMGHHRSTSTSLPWVITALPARPCHGSSPLYQHVLAMGHHRKSFAVRSLCVVVALSVAISVYKPFFMTTHLVDNDLVSIPDQRPTFPTRRSEMSQQPTLLSNTTRHMSARHIDPCVRRAAADGRHMTDGRVGRQSWLPGHRSQHVDICRAALARVGPPCQLVLARVSSDPKRLSIIC